MAQRTPNGNRGMAFESLVEFANGRYMHDGTAIITKQHTKFIPIRAAGQVVSCKVEEKATVDFMGRYGSRPIAFEAKHSADDKIDLKRVEQHQCDFLSYWTADREAIGFILASFALTDVYLIPWPSWKMAKAARTCKQNGETLPSPTAFGAANAFIPTGKASIRKDELPEKWRVKQGGTVGLDYLDRVKAIWGLEAGT